MSRLLPSVGLDTYGCERCREAFPFGTLDYCASCSRNLCEKCMRTGCCGSAPAKSGLEADAETGVAS